MIRFSRKARRAGALGWGLAAALSSCLPQELIAQVTSGVTVTDSASPPAAASPATANPAGPPAAGSPTTPPGAGPAAGTPPTEQATPGAAAGAAAGTATAESTTIKRPSTPARVPDPREFDVRPDANARVQFNFHGQLWPDLLQWLATIQSASLDWQELPNDYLHLSTNRALSLPETHDLFNRLLFERGFTMVRQGNVLLVVKLDKLDPSMLRRVDDEAELLDLPAHDFVKTTFKLPDELKADKAAEDIKPLVSRFAKVQPLMATNRLLVVDVVANLREVSHVINAEHASSIDHTVPREFTLRFARAEHVADQVMILLGLDPSSRRTPEELQVEQQRLQLFAQMQQQGKDVTKFLRSGEAPQVFLAVNHRNNSVVVNAPRKEMDVIERAVELLDVPDGILVGAAPTELTIVRYQLVTMKPQSIVTALQDIGDLDPRTRLRVDSESRVVFAHATAKDHDKIKVMIDHLDGTGRQFEVIWLRRLPADSVALTIHNLMVGKEEEQDDNSRRGYYFFSYRDQEEESQPASKGFRVDADIENNRLLLWANTTELKEVRNFLIKLGEIPGDSTNPRTVRVLEPRSEEATRRMLDQLQRIWPSVGPNPLEIEVAPAASDPATPPDHRPLNSDEPGRSDEPVESDAAPASETTTHETQERLPASLDHAVQIRPSTRISSNLPDDEQAGLPQAAAELTTPLLLARAATDRLPVNDAVSDNGGAAPSAPSAATTRASATLPPIRVSLDEQGRMIISSSDTRALDQLEDLIGTVAGKPKAYEVFYLRHASASLVTLNLEEYFEEEGKSGSSSEDDYWRGWYGFDMSNDETSSPNGLSQRRKIRFIYDFDTNSILVSNATPDQMEIVRSLVKVYDKPLADDSISARRFEIFKMRYAKAADVAKTIKEVYRDLLSAKDQVFERGKDEKEQTSQGTNIYRVYGGMGGGEKDDDKKPTKIKTSFAGALSVGVDEVSNTVIVSAQEEWMTSIAEMIRFLDQEAAPYRSHVEVVSTRISPAALQAALDRVFGADGPQVATKKQPPEAADSRNEREPAETPPAPPIDPDEG